MATKLTELREDAEWVITQINVFEQQCAEEEYTDTGGAWRLLEAARDSLKVTTACPHEDCWRCSDLAEKLDYLRKHPWKGTLLRVKQDWLGWMFMLSIVQAGGAGWAIGNWLGENSWGGTLGTFTVFCVGLAVYTAHHVTTGYALRRQEENHGN